jgi:hypothetical protein
MFSFKHNLSHTKHFRLNLTFYATLRLYSICNIVKKAIHKANEEEIRHSIEPYKKMKHLNIADEEFGCKQYLSTLPLEKLEHSSNTNIK